METVAVGDFRPNSLDYISQSDPTYIFGRFQAQSVPSTEFEFLEDNKDLCDQGKMSLLN